MTKPIMQCVLSFALLMLGAAMCFAGQADANLISAINSGNVKDVTNLLAHGAGANTVDQSGSPALCLAAKNSQAGIVHQLLIHGASVNAADSLGLTSLAWSANTNSLACVKLLIAAGANVNAVNNNGVTVLDLACLYAALPLPPCAVYLVNHGARVNPTPVVGDTPLFDAVVWHHVPLIQFLLKHGANPNVAVSSGATPLSAAQRDGATQIVQLLKQAGARQ